MVKSEFVSLLSMICLILILGSFILGWHLSEKTFEKRLVESNHAEYYLDNNNKRQWRIK